MQLDAWQLNFLRWLALVGAVVAVGALLLVLVRARRRLAARRHGDAEEQGLSLDGIWLSPIDRVFPRRPRQFLMLVATISLGAWLTGYMLAPDVRQFLRTPEWIFQPLYIAAHLVALRLFINAFTRNYAAGVSHLDVSRKQALRGVRAILGPWGALAAAAIAAPFCFFDLRYLWGPRYVRMGGGDVGPIDLLMWGIWSLEWFINALIWVLLVGFMVKNCLTLTRYPFRSPIHTVLADKQYRPFLQMSAQGATVVLGFSLVSVAYIAYTDGALTDYLGLGITVTLLVVCFLPPWLVLRSKVARAVDVEVAGLRQGARLAPAAGPFGTAALDAGSLADRPLEARVDEALALLRIWHLQNLYGNLGETELRAILVRLMAPAATIGWQVAHNYGDLAQRIAKLVGTAAGKP
jgi:hypothetical protein